VENEEATSLNIKRRSEASRRGKGVCGLGRGKGEGNLREKNLSARAFEVAVRGLEKVSNWNGFGAQNWGGNLGSPRKSFVWQGLEKERKG